MIIITVARKPVSKRLVDNITQWGTGSFNIDGSRIPFTSDTDLNQQLGNFKGHKTPNSHNPTMFTHTQNHIENKVNMKGRWPSNVILEKGFPVQQLDIQSGIRPGMPIGTGPKKYGGGGGFEGMLNRQPHAGFGGSGGASRFFKQVKPK